MGFCTDTSPVTRAMGGVQSLIGCRYQWSEQKARRWVLGEVVLGRGVVPLYLLVWARYVLCPWFGEMTCSLYCPA